MTNKKYNPFADMYNFNANSSNWVQRLGHNADFYNNPLGYNSSPTPRPYDNTTASAPDDDNEVISGFTLQTPRTTSLNNGFNVNKQQPSMGNMSSFNLKGNNNASDFNTGSNNWVQRLGHNADFYNNPLGYNSSPTPRPYDNTAASGINNSFNVNNRQMSLSGLESYNQPQKKQYTTPKPFTPWNITLSAFSKAKQLTYPILYATNYLTNEDFRNRERLNVIKKIEEPISFLFRTITPNIPEYIDSKSETNKFTVPQSLNGNLLTGKERIEAYKQGKDIIVNLPNREAQNFGIINNHDPRIGKYYVDKYSDLIEKYAKQNNLNSDIVKAILFSEASDYHQNGANRGGDLLSHNGIITFIAKKLGIPASTSIWPMNIQGKTWGDFQGRHYNVYNPEQNIALSTQVLKAIADSVPDKDIAKIATLWNNTGADNISDYGLRTKYYYDNKLWQDYNQE